METTGRIFQKGASRIRAQSAALCWQQGTTGIEVLLITSRDTGRWVVPKGWLMRGLTAAESAAREAYEEAGVRGQVDARSLGRFGYDKVLGVRGDNSRPVPCLVTVFPLLVDRLTDRFPEAGQRQRIWFLQAEAADLVAEQDLRRLIAGFVPDGAGSQAASA